MLFDKVCEHLNLLEKDYFGLLFQESPEQKVSDFKFICLFLEHNVFFLLTSLSQFKI